MDYETFPGSQLLTHLKNMKGESFVFGLQLDVKHLKQKKKHNIDLKTNHSLILFKLCVWKQFLMYMNSNFLKKTESFEIKEVIIKASLNTVRLVKQHLITIVSP